MSEKISSKDEFSDDEYQNEVFEEEPIEEYEDVSECSDLSNASEIASEQKPGEVSTEVEINTMEGSDSNVELEVSSNTPTDFDSEDHEFHLDFLHSSLTRLPESEKRYKNGTRKSLSFTNERMREIERHNRILLQRILTKNSTYANTTPKRNHISYSKNPPPGTRVASAAINRKNHQRQIELDNQVLGRKLAKIAFRRPRH